MTGFSIGISGLSAAQKALEVIGNNIANAATEGYHRQRVELSPAYFSHVGSVLVGGGVEIEGITRIIDNLLEREILRQGSLLEEVSQELTMLQSVESAFGELSTEEGGLNAALDRFFNALQDISLHPGEAVWQNQVISAAEVLASQFRMLGDFLTRLENQIGLEAENAVGEVNTLINQIAELNGEIERLEITGGEANNLRDKRDQYITELSKYIGVETVAREYGVVDVSAAGIGVVVGSSCIELETGLNSEGKLGITVAGAYNYITELEGGRLGGFLSLRNELVSEIHVELDDLASAVIQKINQYHVQGVGSEGSFTELTGWTMASENLSDFEAPITDGKIYIRVIDTSTGEITRNEIDIDVSTDTLSSMASDISSITGLTASVVSSKLQITADSNYEFDFLGAVLPEPVASTLTGGSPPTISVSGIYTGTSNDTFRFTVSGAGSVGNGTLQLEVRDGGGAGDVIATLNIGAGYAAGDELDVGNGIKISLSTGDFGAGDNFDVDAFFSTDTSGFLSAVGLNTFFSGSSASDISVCSDIVASPGRLATALGGDMTDNANALRLCGLRDEALSSLDLLTPGEFYRRLVTNLGQEVSVKQMRQESIMAVVQSLSDQQSEISGVDINNEAANLLVFEQMFQAMAKYISTVQTSISTIMEML